MYNVGFNDMRTTPLGLAAFNGDTEQVHNAIAKGIDWEKEYDSPLEGALMTKDLDMAQVLIAAGSPITNNIISTVHFINSHKMMDEILSNHAIVDFTADDATDWMNTLVCDPLRVNTAMALRLLGYVLEHGADPDYIVTEPGDYKGWPVLNVACYRRKIMMIIKLVEAGADINARNPFGYSPLYCSAMSPGYINKKTSHSICVAYLQSKQAKFIPALTLTQKIRLYFSKQLAEPQ